MTWALALGVLGVAVVAAGAWWLGRPRPAVPDPVDEVDEVDAPAGAPTFALAYRGYRMDQVDDVVDRLEARIALHDNEIARLRGEPEPHPAPSAPVAGAPGAPPEDPPPPRPHPAATTRHAVVAGTPAPLRRLDLLAPLGYLLVAAYVLRHLLVAVHTGYLSQGVQDQQAFEWYFGATAHNLATLANPLFSDLQNYPEGVNLMANAAVLGLGVPLAPLTLLAGPQWTFVVVELLGLTLTASAWYWLVRRHLAVHPAAAAVAGAVAGFAPGLVSHANGHPNFVVQALVPVIVDRLLRLAGERARPVRDGVVLGLLAAWQVLIGEEVLLLAAIGLAVVAAVLLAHGRLPWRRMLPGTALGAGVALALVAVPLWWQFRGPRSYASIYHPPAGNDLAQLWGRATRTIGADPWASAAVSMNRTEENSFFGWPLLLAALVVVVLLWRRPLVRALGAVVVLACWLSLGEEVTLDGVPTGIPGPWALLEQLPVVENVLPTRLALVAVPALGILLALGVEEVRRRADDWAEVRGPGLALGLTLAALALLPVVPSSLVVDPRDPVPAFFTDGTWRQYVDDGGSVLAAPPPNVADTRALEWQAAARWGFPVVAGYFVGPDGTAARGGQYGATPTGLTQWLAGVAQDDKVVVPTAQEVQGYRADLRSGRVDAIVLPVGRPSADALRASLTAAFGAPRRTGGVDVWDVRKVTDGAG